MAGRRKRALAPPKIEEQDLLDYINSDDESNLEEEATQGTVEIPSPKKVGRRRSGSFCGTNPLETPISKADFELLALRNKVIRDDEAVKREKQKRARSQSASKSPIPGVTFYENRQWVPTAPTAPREVDDIPENAWQQTLKLYRKHQLNRQSSPKKSDKGKGAMNYQNYIDSPGPGANPRQAPPSPSQGMNHITNGMNGMGMGGMVGYPTPAGHQSDLNYVMQMVEELSGVLRHNQALTASVVEKVGKVRDKAANMNLTNDEVIAVVANELNGKSLCCHLCRSI